MILIDSNVPMYLVGADHPHKDDARRLLEQLIAQEVALITDVEVLQEILHRYTAIERRDAIQPAFDVVLGIVEEVVPVIVEDTETAKDIVLGGYGLSARDAIHLAVMHRLGCRRVLSFDRGYDRFPGIERLG